MYTVHTQKNGAISKVNKQFMSHITRAQHTPSAAAAVQVYHALPAVRFSCLLRGRGASFKDGVAEGEGFLCAVANGDKTLLPWPPLSPDLTPCDFFLWGVR
jgi:hypothetical protein